MTDQELFDKVSKHLLTQNKKSVSNLYPGIGCMYRGDNGTSCAIGCLISDDKYSADLEYRVCTEAKVMNAAGIVYEQKSLARDLQLVHDMHLPGVWAKKLACVAEKHGLCFGS